jgi:hypothetical protein
MSETYRSPEFGSPPRYSVETVAANIARLLGERGDTVDLVFPGTYSINGGPELTINQFIQVASERLSPYRGRFT